MQVEIIEKDFNLILYGVSGISVNNNFGETGFKLMNDMWEKVKSHSLRHKGVNTWVYETEGKMFTGVELENNPSNVDLELKEISLKKYAYYKHIGPYSQFAEVYSNLNEQLNKRKLKTCFPWLEIYGHWNKDESKLETEILMCLK
jgi:effector-binding domain-containing protein